MPTSRLRSPPKPLEPIRRWIQGGPVQLSELAGAPFVIHFWSVDCAECHDQMPEIAEWERRFGKRGLKMVSVHVPLDAPPPDDELVEGMFVGHGLAHPLALDDTGRVAAAYEVRATPAYFVYDAEGKLRHFHSGASAHQSVARVLERLLGEAEGTSPAAP